MKARKAWTTREMREKALGIKLKYIEIGQYWD